jgi:heme/copper-type cytochrome/quinol oxidase subunit 3
MAVKSTILTTTDAEGRRVLDVSGLNDYGWDSADPVWWGNLLVILIETTTLILLIVSYFYIRRNFDEWPPPQSNSIPTMYRPYPDLPIPTIELAMIVLSCLPMYLIDMAARKLQQKKVVLGLWFMFLLTLAAIVMRFFEFPGLHFKWYHNAYGSVTWLILGTHLTYLIAQAAEFFIMALWLSRKPIDEKHALDVTLAGGYWYWVAATWIAAYATVYIAPRF